MTTLTDFIQLIKQNSIARTNRFRVTFTIPDMVMNYANFIGKGDIAKTLSLTCLITDVPTNTKQISTVGYGNYDRKVAHGRDMGDFTTSFLLTGKYLERKLFDVWANIITVEGEHAVNYYDDYITNIHVECLNEQDLVMYQFDVTEAWPIALGQLRLDRTAQNAQMVLDVTWAFHRVDQVFENVTTAKNFNTNDAPGTALGSAASNVKRLLPIPGIDGLSETLQSAAGMGTELRGQLQGVLNIATDVREQVRDLKMSSVNGVKILNGVVKDVKGIAAIPSDVKNEVLAVVNDTKNQIGYLKNDTKNIANYPKR